MCKEKKKKREKHWQGIAAVFLRNSEVKMRISVLDKTELWCLHSNSVKLPFSPCFHETTINERDDFKGPLGWRLHVRASVEGEGKKSPILLSRALSLSPSPLSLWELTEVLTVAVNSLCRPAGRQGSTAMGRPFCTSRTPSVCRIACQKYQGW